MHTVIHTFYEAFQKLDSEAMVACYHRDISFSDPAFGTLRGEQAKNMWRMLVASQQGKNFEVYFDSIEVNQDLGSAHWEAKYMFSKTGRPIHNIIEARFQLKDGLIYKHQDHFNLHKWAGQALGFKGWLLGGTAFFRKKLQKQTRHLLQNYETKKAEN